jgi:hypothetical protein
VSIDDPEMMLRPGDDIRFQTHAQFHFEYLRTLLAEKNTHYSKSHPGSVKVLYYLEQLRSRVEETDHLRSFKNFYDFCKTIQGLLRLSNL